MYSVLSGLCRLKLFAVSMFSDDDTALSALVPKRQKAATVGASDVVATPAAAECPGKESADAPESADASKAAPAAKATAKVAAKGRGKGRGARKVDQGAKGKGKSKSRLWVALTRGVTRAIGATADAPAESAKAKARAPRPAPCHAAAAGTPPATAPEDKKPKKDKKRSGTPDKGKVKKEGKTEKQAEKKDKAEKNEKKDKAEKKEKKDNAAKKEKKDKAEKKDEADKEEKKDKAEKEENKAKRAKTEKKDTTENKDNADAKKETKEPKQDMMEPNKDDGNRAGTAETGATPQAPYKSEAAAHLAQQDREEGKLAQGLGVGLGTIPALSVASSAAATGGEPSPAAAGRAASSVQLASLAPCLHRETRPQVMVTQLAEGESPRLGGLLSVRKSILARGEQSESAAEPPATDDADKRGRAQPQTSDGSSSMLGQRRRIVASGVPGDGPIEKLDPSRNIAVLPNADTAAERDEVDSAAPLCSDLIHEFERQLDIAADEIQEEVKSEAASGKASRVCELAVKLHAATHALGGAQCEQRLEVLEEWIAELDPPKASRVREQRLCATFPASSSGSFSSNALLEVEENLRVERHEQEAETSPAAHAGFSQVLGTRSNAQISHVAWLEWQRV